MAVTNLPDVAQAARNQFELVLAFGIARQSGDLAPRPQNLTLTGDQLTSPTGPNASGTRAIT